MQKQGIAIVEDETPAEPKIDLLIHAMPYGVAAAVVVFAVVILLYVANFRAPLSSDHSIWGAFGDYLGGTLNPIFSFFAFVTLIFSLRLQIQQLYHSRAALRNSDRELKATLRQLERTAIAQESAAAMLKKQELHSALSARVATLSAMHRILAEQVTNESKFMNNPGVNPEITGRHWEAIDKRNAIAAEILRLTDQLMAP